MIKRVQLIGHIKSAADLFLGRARELTVNTTDNAIRAHDGATIGGHEQARQDMANVPAADGATDGKMTAAQAGDLSTNTTNLNAHIGNRTGHPVATDALDGFMVAADKAKLDGVEAGATADQSAADIRGLGFFDVSNDGATSGLDADLVDGFHAAKAATINTAVVRDAAGRAKVVAPAVAGDIALKSTVDAVIPSDTIMLFVQTAAPVGFTKLVTQNNKALRIVSGTAGVGGATAFTSVFGAGKNTGSHTLVNSEVPAHTHTIPSTALAIIADSVTGTFTRNTGAGQSTGSSGGGGGHAHTLSLDLQFVDIIQASKD